MSDLVELRVVSSVFEADVVCGLLRDAGIKCTHRDTALSVAARDGMPGGGPRVVLVRAEDAAEAREALDAPT